MLKIIEEQLPIKITEQLMVRYINLDEGFKKIRATVRPENINSQRCLEKLGFESTGTFIKSETIGDKEVESERLLYIRSL